jgi:hypothetical protein
MSSEQVSKQTDGNYTHKLHNKTVKSALEIAGQLPELYDYIYEVFPNSYNKSGGKFGLLNIVKIANDMRVKPTSHFTEKEVNYSYPDGLILPIVYGLKSLMRINKNGAIQWKEDPYIFLKDHLDPIVKKYKVILEAFRYDPQKVGKNEGSYEFVLDGKPEQCLSNSGFPKTC